MKTNRTIFTGAYSNKQAEQLREMLAQRLRQSVGVNSIQDARACLTVERAGVGRTIWWEIHLVPMSKRPVKKLPLTRGEMHEFLRGVLSGQKSAGLSGRTAV